MSTGAARLSIVVKMKSSVHLLLCIFAVESPSFTPLSLIHRVMSVIQSLYSSAFFSLTPVFHLFAQSLFSNSVFIVCVLVRVVPVTLE